MAVIITNGSVYCPYCNNILEKAPGRKKKCQYCNNFIFVRTRPIDRKRVLVTEKEAKKIDEEWGVTNIYNNMERLPLPIVHYPSSYGTFLGFQGGGDPTIKLCSCTKNAIQNYLRFRLSKEIPQNTNPLRMFVLDSFHFPTKFIKNLIDIGAPNNHNVTNYINFENKICHECNKVVPKATYCHKMYGGTFKQKYGWYINKQAYELGVEPITNHIISEICPQEILDIIKLDPEKTNKLYFGLLKKDGKKAYRLKSEFEKQNTKVWNFIENKVREKFGYKKVGECWTSETVLYYIIKSIFPNKTILRHYRPNFLQGLELDIFIKDLKIGIEYQGIQHFEPVEYWGGREAFEKLKARDKKKREICNSLGIKLIYFEYDENLTESIVLAKLKS